MNIFIYILIIDYIFNYSNRCEEKKEVLLKNKTFRRLHRADAFTLEKKFYKAKHTQILDVFHFEGKSDFHDFFIDKRLKILKND